MEHPSVTYNVANDQGTGSEWTNGKNSRGGTDLLRESWAGEWEKPGVGFFVSIVLPSTQIFGNTFLGACEAVSG